jgi:hypothetical protein
VAGDRPPERKKIAANTRAGLLANSDFETSNALFLPPSLPPTALVVEVREEGLSKIALSFAATIAPHSKL